MALLSVITLLIKNPTVGYSVYLKLLIITYINYCFFTPWVQAGPLSSAVPVRGWGSAEWIYTSVLNSVHGFRFNKTLLRFKELWVTTEMQNMCSHVLPACSLLLLPAEPGEDAGVRIMHIHSTCFKVWEYFKNYNKLDIPLLPESKEGFSWHKKKEEVE